MKINLSGAEIQMAAFVGCQRMVENIVRKTKPRYGAEDETDWQINIEGALAECALAKHLGKFWAKGETGDLDVGRVNVRSTRWESGCLLLHPSDEDNVRFYLLVGVNGQYRLAGSVLAKDGKQEKYWEDRQKANRWAYFVPQEALEHGY